MIEIIFTRPMTIYNSSEPINSALFFKNEAFKPGFHIVVSVVSVVSVVRKKFIGQIIIILWKPPVQMLNTKETTYTHLLYEIE